MHILIAGATGFIGRHLVRALQDHHLITALGRNHAKLQQTFAQPVHVCTWDNLKQLPAKDLDVVINLSGSNIAAKRWNPPVKQELIDSRVKTNAQLIHWLITNQAKPHYYCANAVGFYGIQPKSDPTAFDENTPIDTLHPKDFLNEIGIRWQQAVQPAIDDGIPVTITHFGVVLDKNAGMLKKLRPSFNLGLGSIIGDGQQIISWVHIQDVINAFQFLMAHPQITGRINITSPQPVTQTEFAQTLAKKLHKPLFLKFPAFMVRLLFGEMGDSLLNSGQRVIPTRLLQLNFEFQYPNLSSALHALA